MGRNRFFKINKRRNIWKRDYQWDNVKADFIVENLEEIPLIVEKLNNQNIKSY
ncbi:hypothetical protein [Alkalihalobacillus sp. TS-13]|uniref:hypothetical protein n=1 Tax=Alkalihalobacillus sp. TS-13 TaxID=2842455 RepID=UPI001C867AB9|nr:hypothetical protein [Alkalihalobacillus sp. TS-13]